MDRGFVLGLGIPVLYAVLTAAGVSGARESADAEGSARVELDGQPATYGSGPDSPGTQRVPIEGW